VFDEDEEPTEYSEAAVVEVQKTEEIAKVWYVIPSVDC